MISLPSGPLPRALAAQPEQVHGVTDRRQRVAQLVAEHGQELVLAAVGLGQLLSVAFQLLLQPLALGDVPKDEDHSHVIVSVILDGRRTIVDGSPATVPCDQDGMVSEPDSQSLLDDLPDRLIDRFPGLFIDDVKDVLDRPPDGVGKLPSGELLRRPD